MLSFILILNTILLNPLHCLQHGLLSRSISRFSSMVPLLAQHENSISYCQSVEDKIAAIGLSQNNHFSSSSNVLHLNWEILQLPNFLGNLLLFLILLFHFIYFIFKRKIWPFLPDLTYVSILLRPNSNQRLAWLNLKHFFIASTLIIWLSFFSISHLMYWWKLQTLTD